MTLRRDDVLRELELLPVWRLNAPLPSAPVEALTELQAETPVVAHAQVLPAVQVVVEPQLEQTSQPEPESEQELRPQTMPQPSIEATPVTKTPIAWMLVCAQIQDDACQTLFDNIIKALRLSVDDYVLVHKRSQMMAYESERTVLFGLNAANAVLNQTETDIQALRGRIHRQGQTQYIVTHAPQALLTEPALKKEVWHDLCLLLI